VPVHAHHRAKRLEPEWVGKSSQEFVSAIFENDGFGDDRAQSGHTLTKPCRDTAAMKREIGAACALSHCGGNALRQPGSVELGG
jgi:hypothetical protein